LSDNVIRAILPIKSDIVFRMFFADERDTNDLVRFLKAVLRLPEDDYNDIKIADPHLLREFDGDKLAIIDVKLQTKNKKTIHIEIQLQVTSELKNRILYYGSKLITEQLGSGDEYENIKQVVSIVITEENLIKTSPKYYHRFVMYDCETGVEFTDLLEIHTLELGKLPTNADGTDLYDWAKFINAETEEELEMIAERNPQFQNAVVKLRELSADEKARDAYERREKARRDHNMFLRNARREAVVDVARNALQKNMPIGDIADITGLTREEIESLQQQ